MKIAICDDEIEFQRQLKREIEEHYHSLDVLICTFLSGEELLKVMEREETGYNLIFMDIQMPGISGLETAKRIRKNDVNTPIILLTSHTEFAMDGYEINAFRFLEKPLNKIKLIQALNVIEKQKMSNQRIIVTDNGKEYYLAVWDVIFIKSENVYLQLILSNKSYLIRQKLKQQLEKLPKQLFLQVHRSYIINLAHVSGYDGKIATMDNGIGVPVSRSYRNEFKNRLMHYLKEIG